MLDTKYLNCVASTMLEGIDVRCTIPCTQPLYTIKVGILSAATSPLFGRQGDAFGVVVGKLTKKKIPAAAHVTVIRLTKHIV
jgi:hypothetical protein